MGEAETTTTTALGDRLPAPLRLRSTGFGVVAAAPLLAVLSVLAPFGAAAGVLVVVALVGAGAYRNDVVLLQVFLGIGAVGVIGLLEAYAAVGLGLSAMELAALALALGLVDVVFGTILNRFSPGAGD